MSLPVAPSPALLIVAVILSPTLGEQEAAGALVEAFGPVADKLPFVPYTETKYYEKEMGEGLTRGFFAFANPYNPGELSDTKLTTNAIETGFAQEGRRRVNFDPGALDMHKFVLPSCKEAAHRVYLGKGVHAEIEYRFISGTFAPLEWTYPDYRNPRVIKWFNDLREGLRVQRKA